MAGLESAGSPSKRGRASSHFAIHEEEEGKHSTAGAASCIGSVKPTTPSSAEQTQSGAIDALLTKLSESQIKLAQQQSALSTNSDEENIQPPDGSSNSSALFTPASDARSNTYGSQTHDKSGHSETIEVSRLKRELDVAKERLAFQAQEINQRVPKQTLDTHTPLAPDGGLSPTVINRNFAGAPRQSWVSSDEARSDFSDSYTSSNVWSAAPRQGFSMGMQPDSAWGFAGGRAYNQRNAGPMPPPQEHSFQQRNYAVPLSPGGSNASRVMSDSTGFSNSNMGRGFGRFNFQDNRNNQAFAPRGNFDMYTPSVADNLGGMNPGSAFQNMGAYQGYQPQPIGTPLSPTASTFSSGGVPLPNPWNSGPPSSPGQTYLQPMEPLNYRRLLDRSVSCNWKYIVDKIVCNNDQQASIFLQQKLKVGTAEQKYDIIESIVAQAYPLMVNRFGNFLVQRCFEHGTPEQVNAIASAIRGNTLSLSMDPFGCHVVQKAFDTVPEEYKAVMVHELLRRIPETVIHRYACHVWQKLFELRWSDSPPQIMKFVNEALRGMWHEVALGETGSLVVQNIFENCLEEDKRPCINEVLGSIDIVAHGQFGNWCIQHVCEHGAPADRSRAIEHILRYATEYSMDQFASKVVEKCLKIGGSEFLERYLERVCEGRPDRPRIPLIDSG
ncbi:uncharacterized protein KY384_000222 [Bacidia gigantensis]|uniref:uncharacterized protein n=1 Tax=Bacidia gigantensis TaxID=2732470 RepID=UPI001D048662|nr:uncharacterized protein KY384_000222 [Bacidia gigantensis]KAG8526229.1 hypothetical protein KY384_000222 [Bacidia gigantensis]